MHLYRTAPAQQATVRLVDGSTMTLAPATTVRVTPTAVTVAGQAYFDITHRSTQLFVVQTANAEVRVLGTRFVVRQYPGEPVSQVVVADGKVDVAHRTTRLDHQRTLLTARMLGRVTDMPGDSGVTVSRDIAVEDYVGWTHGTLVFTSARLHDVVAELGRAYGVEIRVLDSTLASQPLTFVARVRTQPITQVLDFIGRVTEAHSTRVDSTTFMLTPGRASTTAPHRTLISSQEQQYGR
jgi:ferric-dicitrate binding protein FerR (iron transport regulator)